MKELAESKILSEHQEQVMFIKWMQLQHPTVKVAAIPNGIRSSIGAAVKAKREGLSKGFPDLFIARWKLFIEMKRKKGGVVSKEQREWLTYLEDCGFTCKVCRGFEEAKLAVIEHLDSL